MVHDDARSACVLPAGLHLAPAAAQLHKPLQISHFTASTNDSRSRILQPMKPHPFSVAMSEAIIRIDGSQHNREDEVFKLLDDLRVRLELDNAHVVMSLVFLQFLLQHYAYTDLRLMIVCSHVFGTKMCTEGFYSADVIDRVDASFTVDQIEVVERFILQHFDFGCLKIANRRFKKGLLKLVLEDATTRPCDVWTRFKDSTFVVLIVDDDKFTLRAHVNMVQSLFPGSEVRAFDNVCSAMAFVDECHDNFKNIDLVLLDREMPTPQHEPETSDVGALVSKQIETVYARSGVKFLCRRPLVVMVTGHPVQMNALDAEGGYLCCDAVVCKPLTTRTLSKLLQCALP